MIKKCVVCEADFEAKGTSKLCSEVCRSERKRAQKREDWARHRDANVKKSRARYWERKGKTPPETCIRECEVCNGAFEPVGRAKAKKKYCSAECSSIARKTKDAEYRKSAPEKIRERTRKWRENNKGRALFLERERRKNMTDAQRERVRALDRLRRIRNPEKARAQDMKQNARRAAAVQLIRELQSKGLEALL